MNGKLSMHVIVNVPYMVHGDNRFNSTEMRKVRINGYHTINEVDIDEALKLTAACREMTTNKVKSTFTVEL